MRIAVDQPQRLPRLKIRRYCAHFSFIHGCCSNIIALVPGCALHEPS
jgi:hypothetical protein